MSLMRPSSFFSPLFADLDTFPFGRGLSLAPSTAPSDFFRSDNLWSGPRIDLHEEDKQFTLTAELPGVKKEDIKINVDADRRRLTLEGQLKSEFTSGGGEEGAQATASKATPLVSERMYGSFSRTFTLPNTANLADEKACKAKFTDGILRLEIPKKPEEATKTRQVMIEGA